MHHCDVGDGIVAGEASVDDLRVDALILTPLDGFHGPAHHAGHLDHAGAVGAVDEHEQLAVAGNECPYHRLDSEGARALERDADVRLFSTDKRHESGAHVVVHGNERLVRDPQSRSIASLTLSEVVSGPGVSK